MFEGEKSMFGHGASSEVPEDRRESSEKEFANEGREEFEEVGNKIDELANDPSFNTVLDRPDDEMNELALRVSKLGSSRLSTYNNSPRHKNIIKELIRHAELIEKKGRAA